MSIADRKKDVLLVTGPRAPWVSPASFEVSENSCPPLGVLYVAQFLELNGISVVVEDFYRYGKKPSDILPIIDRNKARILGVSTNTGGYPYALSLCRFAKKQHPEIITIMGGIHPSVRPHETLSDDAIDFVVIGEGEETSVELVSALLDKSINKDKIMNIKGIGFKNSGAIIVNQARSPMDIDSIPFPGRHFIQLPDYLQMGALMASRGCPHKCYYCSSVAMSSHKYRYRSPQRILEEMNLLNSLYKIVDFEFLDDDLTGDSEKMHELCSRLATSKFRWGCQSALKDLVAAPDLISKMIDSGCASIFFGVETGNEKMLKKIKSISRNDVINMMKYLRQRKVHVSASFMIGHPSDSKETIKDTIDMLFHLRDLGCHTPVSLLVPFPGSALAKSPDKYGVQIETENYRFYYHNQAVMKTENFSRKELETIYFDILYRISCENNEKET
ncbi:MAG: radical SAM protein [Acidobacteriota bacterium]|nr:radical SAM protein [Acidobacteriota bacterium]